MNNLIVFKWGEKQKLCDLLLLLDLAENSHNHSFNNHDEDDQTYGASQNRHNDDCQCVVHYFYCKDKAARYGICHTACDIVTFEYIL